MIRYDILKEAMELKNLVDHYVLSHGDVERRITPPLVNLYEKDEEVTVKILTPGSKIEDINLELTDNSLSVRIEKKEDNSERNYVRREREFGTYGKTIKMPYRVNHESIKASLENGVLTVKLQKSEEAKPKRIEIL